MKRRFLLVPFVLLMLGCGLITQTAAPTETVQAPPTIVPPSNTPLPTPTVETTDTPIPSATVIATATQASMPSFGSPGFDIITTKLQNVQQFFNPSGSPVKTWNDIPIMSQAVAGQDFGNGVYSYVANANLNQAVVFYNKFEPAGAPSLLQNTGTAQTNGNARHDATFIYSNIVIYITSFDNDTGHVIVVIGMK